MNTYCGECHGWVPEEEWHTYGYVQKALCGRCMRDTFRMTKDYGGRASDWSLARAARYVRVVKDTLIDDYVNPWVLCAAVKEVAEVIERDKWESD